MTIIITEEQMEILKLKMRGETGYSIARKLRMHPPSVYRSLKSAKENITKLRQFLKELEELERKQANENELNAH